MNSAIPQQDAEAISRAVKAIPGFNGIDELSILYTEALSANVPGDMLEIGSWCGLSSIALGLAARRVGCHLYSVDLFPELDDWKQRVDGAWSLKRNGYSAYESEHPIYDETFRSRFLPVYNHSGTPFKKFTMAVESFGLSGFVTPFKGDVSDFLNGNKSGAFRLVFIDGNHDYEGVKNDISHAERVISPGGSLIIDDVTDIFHGVKRAVSEAFPDRGKMLTRKLFCVRGVLDE